MNFDFPRAKEFGRLIREGAFDYPDEDNNISVQCPLKTGAIDESVILTRKFPYLPPSSP